MFEKYFDCNATTPLDASVLAGLGNWALEWGNASSIHWAGRGPKRLIREARQNLAKALGASPLELIFTSGGSESNSTVIKSVFNAASVRGASRRKFLCSEVEHPSLLRSMSAIQALGAQVDKIPVSRTGVLDLDFFQEKLSTETALVSVMTANNETGHRFPISVLAKKAHDFGALFHTDAVQALGKISVNLLEWQVDYASFSAHKCYALKGTGLLYARKNAPLDSLILGGGQERGRRGGTENTLGIAAFGKMAEKLSELQIKMSEIEGLRDYMEERILQEIPAVRINGKETPRLPNTSSLILENVDGETLLMSLDLKGFAVSTGAACSSGNPEPSPVLLAMGFDRSEAQSSLRLSLGAYHRKVDVDNFVETMKEVVMRLRDLQNSSLVGEGGNL